MKTEADGDHRVWVGGVQFRMAGRPWRRLSPSRAGYEIMHGPPPVGYLCARTCDVSGCVAHVQAFIPGQQPNHARESAKLTERQVRLVRRLPRSKGGRCIFGRLVELATEWGVPVSTLRQLRTPYSQQHTWKDVA